MPAKLRPGTLAWVEANAGANALLFVDAPLVVENETGQRLCEKQTGQRYGRWKVSARAGSSRVGSSPDAVAAAPGKHGMREGVLR